jgi:hypothetical protein
MTFIAKILQDPIQTLDLNVPGQHGVNKKLDKLVRKGILIRNY